VICDFDDFCEDDNRLDLLHLLHDANPDFRCTLFAIPGRGSAEFWKSVPEWCELAVHGFEHPHPRECAGWTRFQIETVLDYSIVQAYFTNGWKSPGWQSSDAVYEVLLERGWWIAEHWDNVDRLPDDLRAHIIQPSYREGTWHWHGHIPDVCGNGIAETFNELLERVQAADSFEFISEVVA
jgi:hypothetical protein